MFVLAFCIFTRFQVMQNWLQFLTHFGSGLVSQKTTNISRSDTVRCQIFNQFLDCFFPDIGSFLGAIWEAFELLLDAKTSDESKVGALLLRLPIFFSLESYFEMIFLPLAAPASTPLPPAKRLS